MQRVYWPGVSGAGWPVSRQYAAMLSGISHGFAKRAALGLISERNGSVFSASAVKFA